jgi:hypothetical protein
MATITAVKSFIVQAPVRFILNNEKQGGGGDKNKKYIVTNNARFNKTP